jgi:sugar phosphate isomerase/epimerase
MRALLLCDDGDVAAAAPLCRRRGLGIEVQAFYDPVLLEQEPGAIKAHRDAVGGLLPISLHGPFADLCPGSFDPMVREVARNRFELAYRTAHSLRVTDIVLHHGHVPGFSPPERWLPRWVAFWREFLQGKSGVRFHIENVVDRGPRLLSDVVRELGHPDVDICLDIGHAHCYSNTPVRSWIEELGPWIGYVHLHDNRGVDDEHLGLGQGTLPMAEACAALEEHAPGAIWALEAQVPYLEASLEWLDRRGYVPRPVRTA